MKAASTAQTLKFRSPPTSSSQNLARCPAYQRVNVAIHFSWKAFGAIACARHIWCVDSSFQPQASSLQITLASARDAPWRAAAPAPCGHSSISYARENHASCVAAVHAVEKCASAKNLLLNR